MGTLSPSKNSDFVIPWLDRGIQNILKRLDSRLRENDDFISKWQFLDKLRMGKVLQGVFMIQADVINLWYNRL